MIHLGDTNHRCNDLRREPQGGEGKEWKTRNSDTGAMLSNLNHDRGGTSRNDQNLSDVSFQ